MYRVKWVAPMLYLCTANPIQRCEINLWVFSRLVLLLLGKQLSCQSSDHSWNQCVLNWANMKEQVFQGNPQRQIIFLTSGDQVTVVSQWLGDIWQDKNLEVVVCRDVCKAQPSRYLNNITADNIFYGRKYRDIYL